MVDPFAETFARFTTESRSQAASPRRAVRAASQALGLIPDSDRTTAAVSQEIAPTW